jgi:hypothetical protein
VYMAQSGPTGAAVWAVPTSGEKKPLAIPPVSPGANRSVPALARRPLAGLQLNRVETRGNLRHSFPQVRSLFAVNYVAPAGNPRSHPTRCGLRLALSANQPRPR